MTLETPPDKNEFEVSIFGRGVGECVVVHLGAGQWLVVDSCRNPITRRPVALEYFERIGVDVATSVKRIAVTHWDDDHIRGVSDILEAASSAKFVCSIALNNSVFFRFVASHSRWAPVSSVGSNIEEFYKILNLLKNDAPRNATPKIAAPIWAKSLLPIYREEASENVEECMVTALSPSDATISRGLVGIADQLPQSGLRASQRRKVAVNSNETSVVLHVRLGKRAALLGADLENETDIRSGWQAIVDMDESLRPSKSHIFKIPHHGSEDADCPAIWEGLLEPQPTAAVTAYTRGKKPRPSLEDLQRFALHTPHLYLTTPTKGKKIKRNRTRERLTRNFIPSLRPLVGPIGHVRIRMTDSGASNYIRTETFGSAHRVVRAFRV